MTYTDTNAELAAYEADERENDYFKLIWAMNTLERYPIKLHRNRMRRSSSCTLAA